VGVPAGVPPVTAKTEITIHFPSKKPIPDIAPSVLDSGDRQQESILVRHIEIKRLVAVPDESTILLLDFCNLDDRTPQVG